MRLSINCKNVLGDTSYIYIFIYVLLVVVVVVGGGGREGV